MVLVQLVNQLVSKRLFNFQDQLMYRDTCSHIVLVCNCKEVEIWPFVQLKSVVTQSPLKHDSYCSYNAKTPPTNNSGNRGSSYYSNKCYVGMIVINIYCYTCTYVATQI